MLHNPFCDTSVQGERRVELSSAADGSSGLNLHGRNSEANTSLSVQNDGSSLLSFTDRHGNVTRLDPLAKLRGKTPEAVRVSP